MHPTCLLITPTPSGKKQHHFNWRRTHGGLACLALMALGLCTMLPARATTTLDADTITDAYNSAFYVVSSGHGYYKNDTTGGGPGFWTQAEEIEMIIDAYERSNSATYKQMITDMINGFVNSHGSSWSGNSFNDDILWMVIACARGYQATGNTTFKSLAKSNFDTVYARAFDTALGGGLWWTTGKTSKNACVNGPGILAACFLYTLYGDSSYLTKAQSLYTWERATLFTASSGKVADHINADGTLNTVALTYNQGTFLGGANYLYTITGTASYLSDAQLMASYTQNNLSTAGILPQYSSTGDLSGFNGIFIRWMGRFARERGLWSTYYAWMSQNAEAAFGVRRSDNLSWNKWSTATPAGTLQSWACSDSVVMLNVIPALFETESLTLQASSGDTYRILSDANFSGGAGSILDADATGDYVNLVVPNVSARKYTVLVGVKKLNTRGIVQLAIGQAGNNSPTNLGAPQDLYSASAEYAELNFGTWTPATTSDKWFRFTITGKNASSTGYSEAFDYILLVPQ